MHHRLSLHLARGWHSINIYPVFRSPVVPLPLLLSPSPYYSMMMMNRSGWRSSVQAPASRTPPIRPIHKIRTWRSLWIDLCAPPIPNLPCPSVCLYLRLQQTSKYFFASCRTQVVPPPGMFGSRRRYKTTLFWIFFWSSPSPQSSFLRRAAPFAPVLVRSLPVSCQCWWWL